MRPVPSGPSCVLTACLALGSLLSLGGCFGSSNLDAREDGEAPVENPADGGGEIHPPAGSHDAGELHPTAGGSLPCDVGHVLADRCLSCHGEPLEGSAPYPLNTYAALFDPAPGHAGQQVLDRMIARMTDPARPMPPSGAPPAEEVKVLIAWRAVGAPGTGCSTDPTEPPEVVCSSNRYWTSGNDGSERMNPGRACIACHTAEDDGPRFAFAGTLYPTVREPDRCNGVDPDQYPGVQVEVIDANETVHAVSVNRAGNFFLRRSDANVVFPIRARVLYEGRVREMATPQQSGDCNACHTQDGMNGAPGRVRLP